MPPSSDDDDGAVRRVVVLPKPLHARPAGQLARLAGRHKETTIQLVAGAKNANARGVLAVMAMGAVTGTEVTVTVTGPDAEAVADEATDILTAAEAVDG